MQEEAAYRRAWAQRQAACEARERAADTQRQTIARQAAEDAERRRIAAENAQYIAQQDAQRAAAEAETARLQAETAKAHVAANDPMTISAHWAWPIVVLPLLIVLGLVFKNELPIGLKALIAIVIPVATGVIGMSMGLTNEVTLWQMGLLELPGGVGLFAAIVLHT